MTWLKISDDFGDDCARGGLSDSAFRTHVEGLIWTMRRETGGQLSERDVARFAESTQAPAAVRELCDTGFWQRTPDGYQLRHAMEHQPDPEVLSARREATARRVTRHRRKAAGLTDDVSGNGAT